VPFGATSTYKAIAAAAGSPTAFRATGNALGANPIPIVVPCHRVLATGGGLGGYTGGVRRKELLLRVEGVLL
jgi:methylated-DNA-[protein]-cysteine S-methyltransferase